MKIVGGTYLERCQSPSWNELYGSGLRSAYLLQELNSDLTLYTYISPPHDTTARAKLSSATLKPTESSHTLRFTYSHPFSTPKIWPPPLARHTSEPLSLEGDVVLRFGILEGDARVKGDRVIYDPQSPYYSPARFRANDSEAKDLAIIANRTEVAGLLSSSGFRPDPKELLEQEGASVVVMKEGPLGATVVTQSEQARVPAYRIPGQAVFPIGSGDAFSAVFAHYWGESGLDPTLAADKASRAAACYCSAPGVPITPVRLEESDKIEEVIVGDQNSTHNVYLAGPFFNMSQVWMVTEAREALSVPGIEVFSPYHDVGLGPANDVAIKDIAAINESSVLMAVVNGADPGTLFEVGYARARNIPVVVLAESEPEETLKMIRGTGCDIHDDFATAIYHTIWKSLDQEAS